MSGGPTTVQGKNQAYRAEGPGLRHGQRVARRCKWWARPTGQKWGVESLWIVRDDLVPEEATGQPAIGYRSTPFSNTCPTEGFTFREPARRDYEVA